MQLGNATIFNRKSGEMWEFTDIDSSFPPHPAKPSRSSRVSAACQGHLVNGANLNPEMVRSPSQSESGDP
jgi:hypothetical protein